MFLATKMGNEKNKHFESDDVKFTSNKYGATKIQDRRSADVLTALCANCFCWETEAADG